MSARICCGTRSYIALFLLAAAAWPGCAPQLDPEEYGEIVSGLPKLEGAETPYELPELGEPPVIKEPWDEK